MNGSRVLVAEFAISVSLLSWGAVKEGFWPWPASVARAAFAFAVLSLLAMVNDRFAALLGAGFLLAQVLKSPVDANGNFRFTGGIPQGMAYGLLTVPGSKAHMERAKTDGGNSKEFSPGGSLGRNTPINEQPPKNNGGVVSV